MKPVYVRTDKNGTKIYHDYTCQRCSGRGASEAWKWTGMTCYECGGSGVSKARIIREYTPEYAAKLAAKRQARWEKEQERIQAEAERLNAEFLAEYFPNGKMYIVYGDYDPEFLAQDGAEWINNIGWYFTDVQGTHKTVAVTPDEVTYIDDNGVRMFSHNTYKVVDAKIEALKPVSQYVGTVGENITVTAVYEHCAYYDTKFGTTWVHTFLTADGNILVWKTSNSLMAIQVDDQVTLTGTVKEHSEYRGKKQTVLTRCKITKGKG